MTSKIAPETQVGSIVTERPSRGKVFEKYRIDYCCGGKIPLEEACAKRNIATSQVIEELELHDQQQTSAGSDSVDWNKATMGDLIDNIIHKHHDYMREELPSLLKKSERVAAVHGATHPETVEVLAVFTTLKNEFEEHMGKEEGVLFPWIRGLEQGRGVPPFPGMKMQQPVACMEHDHEQTAKNLERLHVLTNDFTPPEDACNTFRVLYSGLRDLEKDVHAHVHKENNILFPKALATAG